MSCFSYWIKSLKQALFVCYGCFFLLFWNLSVKFCCRERTKKNKQNLQLHCLIINVKGKKKKKKKTGTENKHLNVRKVTSSKANVGNITKDSIIKCPFWKKSVKSSTSYWLPHIQYLASLNKAPLYQRNRKEEAFVQTENGWCNSEGVLLVCN